MSNSVLYVVPSWFTLHYHLNGHLAFMKSRGFEVSVACYDDPRAEQAAEREGAKYFATGLDPQAISPLGDLKTVIHLLRIIRTQRCDIIYCCTKKGALLSAIAGKLAGVSGVVYHVRGIRGIAEDATGRAARFFLSSLESLVCRMVHRVVFISRSNMELYSGKNVCPKDRLTLFGEGSVNGIDTSHYSRTQDVLAAAGTLRKEHGIPGDAYVFGYVGRAVREKGILELMDAWMEIRDRHPRAHLLILSPPETDSPEVVDSLSKDDRVHFTGFMANPVAGYAAMDCLVIPSQTMEGFGNVAIEAGSMELPVVATRVAGLMDAVVDGETGLLVGQTDKQALVQALETLISDEELSRRLAANARRRCISRFSQEIIWRGFAKLYEELISGRGAVDIRCCEERSKTNE